MNKFVCRYPGSLLCWLACWGALICAGQSAAAEPPSSILLENVRVFDGKSPRVSSPMSVFTPDSEWRMRDRTLGSTATSTALPFSTP